MIEETKEAKVERKANAAAATHVGAASHFTLNETVLCVFLFNRQTDQPLVCFVFFCLQLCLGGLGLPAGRLQQETLWFSGAGESSSLDAVLLCRCLPSAGVKREGREEVGLMSHDTLGVVRSSAVARADHSGQ